MGVKPEPDFEAGSYARLLAHRRREPFSVITEIVEKDGVRHARFSDNMSPRGEDLFPLDVLELGGRVRFLLPDPVMRYFRPSGVALPFYGEELRPDVQLWCVRTLGYTPRMAHEDHWDQNDDGSWSEYDTAWFAYFDSDSDKLAFILAFCGVEVLDEFRRQDGSL